MEQLPDLVGLLKFASVPHWQHVRLTPEDDRRRWPRPVVSRCRLAAPGDLPVGPRHDTLGQMAVAVAAHGTHPDMVEMM
jgi:hypothetical protein